VIRDIEDRQESDRTIQILEVNAVRRMGINSGVDFPSYSICYEIVHALSLSFSHSPELS